MRRSASSIGVVLSITAVLALPFATACYAPRIESCRDALGDFSDITEVAIIELGLTSGDTGGDRSIGYRIRALSPTATDGPRCVAVHSELWDGSTLLSTIDTPVTAQVASGVLTTSHVHHYRTPLFGLTIRVTALGQTIEASVDDALGIRDADAGVPSGADAAL